MADEMSFSAPCYNCSVILNPLVKNLGEREDMQYENHLANVTCPPPQTLRLRPQGDSNRR